MVEGKLVLTKFEPPSTFTPNQAFYITFGIRNDGGADTLFINIRDKDTGKIVKSYTSSILQKGDTASVRIRVLLTQNTDFHGRIEAGHEGLY